MDANLGAAARPRARVLSVRCETEAIDGSASPRNPSVAIAARSDGTRILLVACRSSASRASSGIHALAVVFDANQPLAAELRGNDDAARAGVEAVLDQFLDDRCRAFDYLAGRDLIGEVNRQPLDLRHQINPQSTIRRSAISRRSRQIQLRFLKNTSMPRPPRPWRR